MALDNLVILSVLAAGAISEHHFPGWAVFVKVLLL